MCKCANVCVHVCEYACVYMCVYCVHEYMYLVGLLKWEMESSFEIVLNVQTFTKMHTYELEVPISCILFTFIMRVIYIQDLV